MAHHFSGRGLVAVIICLLVLVLSYTFAEAETSPSLSLSETNISVTKGKTIKMVPAVTNVENPKKLKYTWETSDNNVVTVSNGSVKAVNGGQAVITCKTTLEDGSELFATADIIVLVPVSSLKLTSDKQLMLRVGDSFKMQVEVAPENASDQSILWSSKDSSIASVDHDGQVMAVSAGKTTIVGETADGSRKKVQVSIYVPSLYAETEEIVLDSVDGKDFIFNYYGEDWESNVKMIQKGDAFSYTVTHTDNQYTIHFDPLMAASGTLNIKDKKDPKSQLALNVSVLNEAIPLQRYVEITNFKYNKRNAIDLDFKNNTGKEIDGIEFTMIPYNAEHDILFYTNLPAMESNYVGVGRKLLPGKSVSYRGVGTYNNPSIDDIDISVKYIWFSDGTMTVFGDSVRYWYSSKINAYHGELNKYLSSNYPDVWASEKARSVNYGYLIDLVYEWDYNLYGYHHGGVCITEVTPGSIAEKAGLKSKDLIISVDNIDEEDVYYCLQHSREILADGGKVVLKIERPGQDGTIDLTVEK